MKYKQKGILAENNWKQIGSFLRRPPMILIIVLELLALLFLGYRTVSAPEPLEFAAGELMNMSMSSLQTDADGYVGLEETTVPEDGYTLILATEPLELPAGPYLVTVNYKAEHSGSDADACPYIRFYTETPGTLQMYDGDVDLASGSRTYRMVTQGDCPDAQILFASDGCRFLVGNVLSVMMRRWRVCRSFYWRLFLWRWMRPFCGCCPPARWLYVQGTALLWQGSCCLCVGFGIGAAERSQPWRRLGVSSFPHRVHS